MVPQARSDEALPERPDGKIFWHMDQTVAPPSGRISHMTIASDAVAQKPMTPKYSETRLKRIVTFLAFPVFYALNRPALQFFAEAIYDFALRCNGFAIGFHGRYGLSYAEERFLARRLPAIGQGVLFDVGAHHGSYARFLHQVSPGSRIHAFEPHPGSFAILQQRVAGTGVTPVNKAVSDAAGTMQLYDFADSDGSTQASLAQASVGMFDCNTVAHTVLTTTIDDYLTSVGIDAIDFLKIDTEGFDINVLRGAKRALGRGAIKAIQFEFIPADIAMRVTMRDFFELLSGYDLFRLCLNGSLMPLRRYDVKRCEVYVTHNIVALAKA
jgi:FkbM family methyltransferase